MSSSQELAWWWPVALEGEGGSGPQALHLLGRCLVLWRRPDGAPVLMADRCPHRGARLSLGRLAQGRLQCPYHGWQFDSSGACALEPATPGFTPPASSAVECFGVRQAHGLLWCDLSGQAGHALPDLSHLPSRRLVYGPFDVATSAPRAVENFLDTSHFAFVHEGWLGDAAHPEVPPYDVTHTADGRPVIEHYRAWQPRASATAAGGAWVDYRYEVLNPFAALLTKRGEAGGPQDTTDTETPEQTLRDFQVAIFAQDQPVLESQQPKALPLSGGEAMGAADRLSAAYRRYLRVSGISFGTC